MKSKYANEVNNLSYDDHINYSNAESDIELSFSSDRLDWSISFGVSGEDGELHATGGQLSFDNSINTDTGETHGYSSDEMLSVDSVSNYSTSEIDLHHLSESNLIREYMCTKLLTNTSDSYSKFTRRSRGNHLHQNNKPNLLIGNFYPGLEGSILESELGSTDHIHQRNLNDGHIQKDRDMIDLTFSEIEFGNINEEKEGDVYNTCDLSQGVPMDGFYNNDAYNNCAPDEFVGIIQTTSSVTLDTFMGEDEKREEVEEDENSIAGCIHLDPKYMLKIKRKLSFRLQDPPVYADISACELIEPTPNTQVGNHYSMPALLSNSISRGQPHREHLSSPPLIRNTPNMTISNQPDSLSVETQPALVFNNQRMCYFFDREQMSLMADIKNDEKSCVSDETRRQQNTSIISETPKSDPKSAWTDIEERQISAINSGLALLLCCGIIFC